MNKFSFGVRAFLQSRHAQAAQQPMRLASPRLWAAIDPRCADTALGISRQTRLRYSRCAYLLFVWLSLPGMAGAEPSSPAEDGDAAAAQVDAASQEGVDGKPLNEPFSMVDPATGAPIAADQQLTLPGGKAITAGEYYRILNGYQAELNQHGHTLKGKAEVGTVVRTIKAVEQLQQKSTAQAQRSVAPDPAIMEVLQDPEQLYALAKKNADDQVKTQMQALYRQALDSAAPVPLINGNPPEARVVLKPNDELRSLVFKEWTLDIANAESFAVTGKATLQIEANLKAIDGLADARATATVLGHAINLLEGTVKGHGALTEKSQAEVRFAVAGKDLVKRTWTDTAVALKSGDQAELRQQSVRQATKFHFAVGPVPMSGEIGAAGTVGYDWNLGLTGSSGAVAALGFVQVDGFATVAIDVEIAQAGVAGDLTLLNETFKIEGDMGFDVDAATGEPTVTTGVKATSSLTVLDGDLHVFVRAYVPTLNVPPYTEKEWSWEIFQWPGLQLGDATTPKVIFNFRKTVDRHGYSLSGAPSPEDYEEAQVDQDLEAAMAAVTADLARAGDKIVAANTAQITALQGVRNDLTIWLKGL